MKNNQSEKIQTPEKIIAEKVGNFLNFDEMATIKQYLFNLLYGFLSSKFSEDMPLEERADHALFHKLLVELFEECKPQCDLMLEKKAA
ncbi:MAG: hypothetical protein EHM20_00690 [Alphaproteobacteria bacterium]|nr:MAG: hypothetical protein EHM20_00690 [Alphaproteobacteria bacterium]